MKKIHHLIQGTPPWAAFRATHYGASEAAAMLGLSPYMKRNDLLRMKATGSAQEFSEWAQKNILDHGHAVEALARVLVENIINADLYPVTYSDDDLSASCDGLTLDGRTAFEHKQWNTRLAAIVASGLMPVEHMPQCQQVLLVTGAEKLIFVISDGTLDNFVSIDVAPDLEWFARLRDGWAQFGRDLIAYVPQLAPIPAQIDPILALPALHIDVRGEVVMTNLPAFHKAATIFIDGINTALVSDDDFANAEANVKFCDRAERELASTKERALAQTSGLDELFRMLDFLLKQLSSKRIALEKLIISKKKSIKDAIIFDARQRLAECVIAAEIDIAPIRIVRSSADFDAVLKNKRTRASLIDAADTLVAQEKIAITNLAVAMRKKLDWFENLTSVMQRITLFSDIQQLAQKPLDDFQRAVMARIETNIFPYITPVEMLFIDEKNNEQSMSIGQIDDATLIDDISNYYQSTTIDTIKRLKSIDFSPF